MNQVLVPDVILHVNDFQQLKRESSEHKGREANQSQLTDIASDVLHKPHSSRFLRKKWLSHHMAINSNIFGNCPYDARWAMLHNFTKKNKPTTQQLWCLCPTSFSPLHNVMTKSLKERRREGGKPHIPEYVPWIAFSPFSPMGLQWAITTSSATCAKAQGFYTIPHFHLHSSSHPFNSLPHVLVGGERVVPRN